MSLPLKHPHPTPLPPKMKGTLELMWGGGEGEEFMNKGSEEALDFLEFFAENSRDGKRWHPINKVLLKKSVEPSG